MMSDLLFQERLQVMGPFVAHALWKPGIHIDIRGRRVKYCIVLFAEGMLFNYSPILQSLDHLLEALLSCLPVDDVPDSLEVLGLAVLIVKVVSVLPGINTEDGLELANDRVLVCVCPDLDGTSLCVLNQPRPAGTLDACKCGVELLLELIETAVGVVDGSCERSGWRLTTALGGRCQVLPEESVVDVTSTVEVDHGLQSNLSPNIVLRLRLGDLLAEVVVRCDVGVVVVLVVKLHDLAGDVGLESAIVVYTCQSVIDTWLNVGVNVQARSGRVAFPRTNVVAAPARAELLVAARSAERGAAVRRMVEFMIATIDLLTINWV
jgi:hypothetical protein